LILSPAARRRRSGAGTRRYGGHTRAAHLHRLPYGRGGKVPGCAALSAPCPPVVYPSDTRRLLLGLIITQKSTHTRSQNSHHNPCTACGSRHRALDGRSEPRRPPSAAAATCPSARQQRPARRRRARRRLRRRARWQARWRARRWRAQRRRRPRERWS